jgi:hypothetical protein
LRLIQHLAREDIPVTCNDMDPDRFWAPVGHTGPTIVHDHLDVVRMLRVKTSLKLGMVTPLARHSGFSLLYDLCINVSPPHPLNPYC